MRTVLQMTKVFSFTLILLASFSASYGNMAKPYVDGTESSTLFGTKNCKVISERIDLTAVAPVDEDDYAYKLNYKISYRISADQQGLLPLLFIAQNMDVPKSVMVNGVKINLESLTQNMASKFKFLTPSQSGGDFYDIAFDKRSMKWGVQLSELIYFEALILKGENVITVEYDGHPEYNVYGLLREYKIQYALYPSNYWKSFGVIEINIKLPKEAEIRNVNIGTLQNLNNGNYKLTIGKISKDDLKIVFSKKISYFAGALLFLQPFGLAAIAFLISAFFHFKWIKKRRLMYPTKYNFVVPIGMLLVTAITYLVFAFSYDLIKWLLNNDGLKNGYALLLVFTSPFFLLVYGVFVWIVDYQIKKRILMKNTQIESNGRN
ncbi:hypothetical protein EZJ43_13270 [Pedobacter changchengzhani]|uniref:DUF4436 domain-containing protein n=1 Tax=Pedobacter changchengzhani TaxID=2529274 RepID=A0A4R5MJL3_9SPHI|nr:hypothetical protein [Pedobacter changchengzhani]TDG35586.1 hypothetical protein EZJ43_13270 [Pedobacter changchengzhani]